MKFRHGLLCLVVLACSVAPTGRLLGQGKDANDGDEKLKGRVPPYFASVVNDEQRKKIYALQNKYSPQLEDLELQIEKIKAERDKAIDGVLTPAQLAEVNKKRAEAKEKLSQMLKDRAKAKEAAEKAKATEEFANPPKPAAKP